MILSSFSFWELFRLSSDREGFLKYVNNFFGFPDIFRKPFVDFVKLSVLIFEYTSDQQQHPGEDPNAFSWNRLLILGGVAALYIFTASIDPVPETSWSAFYREMLSAGEVRSKSCNLLQDSLNL